MFLSNLHTHSQFSDGDNTLEELTLAALEKGFVSLGFSEHAPSPYEKEVSMPLNRVEAYRQEFARLRQKCAGRIELYLGIELDALSPFDPTGLDYVIGSLHYVKDDEGGAHCIDWKPEMMESAIVHVGGGDIRRLVRRCFEDLAVMAETRHPDIIGHMDIFTKLNDNSLYFDEEEAWYKALCAQAAERLAATGAIVEVNTGLAQRPGRNRPYPSAYLLSCLRKAGAAVTISSDAHQVGKLDFWFREAEDLLRQVGYASVKMLQGGRFVDVAL
jgi:histidinol-phosphatase (PHP family)